MPGTAISPVEVVQVTRFGVWIAIDDAEYYLDHEHFPWFSEATIAQVCDIEMPSPGHLYWPSLDVDLHLDSIENPGDYPLVAKG